MSIFHDPASLMHQARKQLQEKAVSKAQQKFMGMVYAAKKGEEPASPEVAKAAEGISKKEAKKFAKTKHEGLPTHKEEMEIKEGKQPFPAKKVAKQMEKARKGSVYGRETKNEPTPNVSDSEKKETTRFSKMYHASEKAKREKQEADKARRSPTFYKDTHPSSAPKMKKANEEVEIINHLIENGFAETEQNAQKIMDNMSESWAEEILSELSLGQIGGAVEKAADRYVKPNLERIGAQKGREKAGPFGNIPGVGDLAAQAGRRTASSLYDQGKDAIKKGDVNTAIKTGRTALDMLRNSYEHGVYGDDLSELNRLEREQGKESGGNPDKAYQHVARMMRSMSGKPEGQRKKVPGKKPPKAGEYGSGKRSPEQEVQLRRAQRKRSQDNMSSPRD